MYAPSRHPAPIDLKLDAGEGDTDAMMGIDPALLSRYPNARPLEAMLARAHGLAPEQVVVTAGADDALDRACRACLGPGREIVLPVPTFEMLNRYPVFVGATVREVPWPEGPYPVDEVLAAVGPDTAMIAVVTPNNPTGAVATAADLRRLSSEAPHALLLVDLAYTEFADEDLTPVALSLPNALVTRTLSKAWGLAGLRVGYALGPARYVDWLRRVGNPYAASTLSLAVAERAVAQGERAMRARVATIRAERNALSSCLEELGVCSPRSQGNFVLARSGGWLRDALASLGIGVRLLGGDLLRITCPGDAAHFARLMSAVRAALAPEAILFDMDGVLADVSGSYRRAIVETASSFGVTIGAEDVARAKAAGDANNDWLLTQRLIESRGGSAPLEEVIARFEAIYLELAPGERLLCERDTLARLAGRMRLGVVTGRPRVQAERFLADRGVADLFSTLVCMEDAPPKPSPVPVERALAALGVSRGWMLGDTPDDVRAARAAGVVPLGFIPLGFSASTDDAAVLLQSGAARVFTQLEMIQEILPP
jgi:histidinol-phosphate aminotransferase